MPTYDYKCIKCNHRFEIFQPMTAEPLSICPECGGDVKRLIGTGAGPIFKGSGFYQTDYKNNTRNGKGSTSSSSKTAAKKASSDTTENKSKSDKNN